MHHNTKYNTFEQLIHKKLENHQIPVPNNSWNEIERRLSGKRSALVWIRSACAVAAAIIAVLIIMNKPPINQTHLPTIITAATDTTRVEVFHPSITIINTNQSIKKKNPLPNPEIQIPPIDSTMPTTSFISEAESSTQFQPEKERPPYNLSPIREIPDKIALIKKEKKWTLSAAVGTTGSHSNGLNNPPNYSLSLESMDGKSSGNLYASSLSSSIKPFKEMSKSDFTSIRHLPALSFGVMARKSIQKNVAIESGIIYTYLESNFEWPGYQVRQSLHYIGIPVNMLAYLWNSHPHWQIYLSGGVTVEKGLRAIYTQNMQSVTKVTKTIVKSSIDNLQGSLNGALGINYRLGQHFGIFFEPRFGYHFNNNQPISIRTEWPISIGVHIGINYHL